MKHSRHFIFSSMFVALLVAGGVVAWQWPNLIQWWQLEGQFEASIEERDEFWEEHGYYPVEESLVDEIPEEAFTVVDEPEEVEEEPFDGTFDPLPEEEVAIEEGLESGGENTVINNTKEGYKLTLPPDYLAGTWKVESRTVSVGHEECAMNIEAVYGENDNYETTIYEWAEKEKENGNESFQDYQIEKIEDVPIDAYYLYLETPFCSPATAVFIEEKDRIFNIGRNTCDIGNCVEEVDTILNNFEVFDPQ